MFTDVNVPDPVSKAILCDQFNIVQCPTRGLRRSGIQLLQEGYYSCHLWIQIISFPSTPLHREIASNPDVFYGQRRDSVPFYTEGQKKKKSLIRFLHFSFSVKHL